MFDSVRLPHRLDKQRFAALSEPLRERLLDAQFELADLSVAEPSLETVFINLTGKELRD